MPFYVLGLWSLDAHSQGASRGFWGGPSPWPAHTACSRGYDTPWCLSSLVQGSSLTLVAAFRPCQAPGKCHHVRSKHPSKWIWGTRQPTAGMCFSCSDKGFLDTPVGKSLLNGNAEENEVLLRVRWQPRRRAGCQAQACSGVNRMDLSNAGKPSLGKSLGGTSLFYSCNCAKSLKLLQRVCTESIKSSDY